MKQFFNEYLLFFTWQLFSLRQVYTWENVTCAISQCNGTDTSPTFASTSSSWNLTLCNCGADCATYGECCDDATNKPIYGIRPPFDCVELPSDQLDPNPLNRFSEQNVEVLPSTLQQSNLDQLGVKMMRSCPLRFIGEFAVNCWYSLYLDEQRSNYTLKIPVTASNGITYGNKFCAICHNVTNYTIWNIRMNCSSSLEEYTMSQFNLNLTKNKFLFNDTLQRWTHVDGNVTKNCTFEAIPPGGLMRSIKRCHLNFVNRCFVLAPLDYMLACSRYTSLVRHKNGTWFKNEYCALCNNISSADLICTRNGTYPNSSAVLVDTTTALLIGVTLFLGLLYIVLFAAFSRYIRN